MAIRALSRQEFDRFGAAPATLSDLTRNAVEWFADDTGAVIGALAYGESDFDWSCVVLGRDHAGVFRSLGADVGLRGHNDARRLLFERMRAALARGKDLFPLPSVT